MNHRFNLLSAFLVLSFLSCMKEDNSECFIEPDRGALTVSFRYTGDGKRDILTEKILGIELFVFDGNGFFIERRVVGKEDMEYGKNLRFELPSGDYRLVAWGNTNGYSTVTTTDPTNHMTSFGIVHPPQSELTEERPGIRSCDPLYFASDMVEYNAYEKTHRVIDFNSAHIDFEVYVEGFEKVFGTTPTIVLREADFDYDFEMNSGKLKGRIVPTVSYDKTGSIGLAEFSTLRFRHQNELSVLVLDSESEVKFSLGVTEFLNRFQLSVEGIQEVTVPVYIKFESGGEISVSIAQWDSTNVKPEF